MGHSGARRRGWRFGAFACRSGRDTAGAVWLSGIGLSDMTTSITDYRARRDGEPVASLSEIAGRSWPIQPGAGNAGWASWFQLEHHRPGVPDPVRSAKA